MVAGPAGIVGRDPELERLNEALAEVGAGRPRVVVVTGEPGIGKTLLLDYLAHLAVSHDALVVSGRATELERDMPFGPITGALADYLASLGRAEVERLAPQAAHHLGRIFPSFAQGEDAGLRTERFLAYRSVRWLLDALGQIRPVALILDDMQWTDPASGELIAHLLRFPPRCGLLLALAYRVADVPPLLTEAVQRAHQEGLADIIRLRPLSAVDAARLIGSNAGDRWSAALYEESGGNPFYLQELARVRADVRRSSRPPPELNVDVPEAVRAAIAAELSALDAADRRLLQGAAVAGDPFEVDLAAAAADQSGAAVLAGLDRLIAADLVAPTEVPRRFRFRHPLVRAAIYTLSGPGWRIDAHRRLSGVLAENGVPVTLRAHHVERSASVGDTDAVSALAEAAHGAPDPLTAARWLEAAVRLVSEGAHEQRLQLRTALTSAYAASGRLDDAHALVDGILAELPRDGGALRARFEVLAATVDLYRGNVEDSRTRLVRALRELRDPSSPEAVSLMLELCFTLSGAAGDPIEVQSLANGAVQRAEDLGDLVLVAAAHAYRCLAGSMRPARGDAVSNHAEAARRLDGLADEELGTLLDAALKLGWAELQLEHYQDAVDHLHRALRVARETGQDPPVFIAAAGLALALTELGRLAEAEAIAEHALDAGRLLGAGQLAWTLAIRCHVATATGDADIALANTEEGTPELHRLPFFPIGALLAWAFPEALLAAGLPRRARDSLLSHLVGIDWEDDYLPTARCRVLEVLTRSELALNRVVEAGIYARTAEDLAAACPLRMPAVLAGRSTAAVALAAKTKAGARRAADLALDAGLQASLIGAALEEGRSRLLAGRALALAGERAEAVTQLTAARDQLAECGARRAQAEAVGALGRLGKQPGTRAVSSGTAAALTSREQEVAALVVRNLTTMEIAAELYISAKTVETHLSHIFAKLGVSSRRALARALDDH